MLHAGSKRCSLVVAKEQSRGHQMITNVNEQGNVQELKTGMTKGPTDGSFALQWRMS